METGAIRGGMLAGMSHPKLRRALVAMHEQPQQDWTLDALAALCGMSRSVFANSFRNTLGSTPGPTCKAGASAWPSKCCAKGQQLKLIADGWVMAAKPRWHGHSRHTAARPRAWRLAQQPASLTTASPQSVVQRWQALRSKINLYVYKFQFNSPIV
jgi:AraC-like DNA-binding protein